MIRLEVKLDKFKRGIAALARRVKDLTAVARDVGGHVVARIKRSMPSQGEPSGPGEFPASRHGGRGLRGSVTYNVLDGGAGVEIGTPLVYGGVLHFGTAEYLGGPIRPVNAKALAIPLGEPRRPRDVSGLTWRPNRPETAARHKRGVLGIGEGEDFEPLFALQTEVTIEPRPWLDLTDEDEEYLYDALERELDREAFGDR